MGADGSWITEFPYTVVRSHMSAAPFIPEIQIIPGHWGQDILSSWFTCTKAVFVVKNGWHWCGWCCFTRSSGDASDDQLMNLPSFLEAFSSIISQLSQVWLSSSYSVIVDWLIDWVGFNIPLNTLYIGDGFLRVTWPNRQCDHYRSHSLAIEIY